jgi:uncharacterized membrane protein YtjA (UPF0391 family)
VTIITTIGFGGITPTSSEEAFCLIFIEIATFIVIVYNIICIGSIISNKGEATASRSIRALERYVKD